MQTSPAPSRSATTEYLAFHAGRLIARGSAAELAAALQAFPCQEGVAPLVFDAISGEQLELPLDALPCPVEPAKPGRPKLGVVAREVTLLPRDWDWLNQQPGGASVTLRRLVLQARRSNIQADRRRQAEISCYRFMSALAGNEPGFEEAARALFAGQADAFERWSQAWPNDVRQHALHLAAPAFATEAAANAAPDPTPFDGTPQ